MILLFAAATSAAVAVAGGDDEGGDNDMDEVKIKKRISVTSVAVETPCVVCILAAPVKFGADFAETFTALVSVARGCCCAQSNENESTARIQMNAFFSRFRFPACQWRPSFALLLVRCCRFQLVV